jgi:hypothetical protein
MSSFKELMNEWLRLQKEKDDRAFFVTNAKYNGQFRDKNFPISAQHPKEEVTCHGLAGYATFSKLILCYSLQPMSKEETLLTRFREEGKDCSPCSDLKFSVADPDHFGKPDTVQSQKPDLDQSKISGAMEGRGCSQRRR